MCADRGWMVLVSGLASWAAIGTACGEDGSTRNVDVYIEFLWSKPDAGALARQETRSFVLERGFNHQVCVAVIGSSGSRRSLILEAVNERGEAVSRQSDDQYRGRKRCYPAGLPEDGAPGTWSYRVYLDGDSTFAASRTVVVAKDLWTAKFNEPSLVPYVLGRPNYPDAVDRERFSGRLVWTMMVAASGKVMSVEIEEAEGIGEEMKEHALAAGYISLFPVDSRRPGGGIAYKRAMNFHPD